MHLALISSIFVDYKAQPWSACLQLQIQANNNLGPDTATIPFVVGSTPPTDTNPYLTLHPDGYKNLPLNAIHIKEIPERLPVSYKSKILYHINRLTNVHRLYIPPFVAPDILAVTHRKGHPGFSYCYKIITRL